MGSNQDLNNKPAKKPIANANIKEEMAGRLKLEVMYLKKQLSDKDEEINEMNKLIGQYNKKIVDRDKFIEQLNNDFKVKERELLSEIESVKQLIEPSPSKETSSILIKLLNYAGIKVSYI